VEDGPRGSSDSTERDTPYRFWFAGLFIELGTFAAFTAVLVLVTLIIAKLA
jgi:hypothetical protein